MASAKAPAKGCGGRVGAKGLHGRKSHVLAEFVNGQGQGGGTPGLVNQQGARFIGVFQAFVSVNLIEVCINRHNLHVLLFLSIFKHFISMFKHLL